MLKLIDSGLISQYIPIYLWDQSRKNMCWWNNSLIFVDTDRLSVRKRMMKQFTKFFPLSSVCYLFCFFCTYTNRERGNKILHLKSSQNNRANSTFLVFLFFFFEINTIQNTISDYSVWWFFCFVLVFLQFS